MNEWWSVEAGTWIGSLGGGALGLVGGTLGAAIGLMAPQGYGRRVLVPIHVSMVALGGLALLAGLAALAASQPRHVWYPLLLLGGLTAAVLGGLLPVVLARYRQAEQRRMDAEALRRE